MNKLKIVLMKIVKRILIGIIILILLIVLVSFFLPSTVHVQRSEKVNATNAVIYDFVNDLKKWKHWSPWFSIDTTTVYTFSENPVGEGAWYTWKSENPEVREGKLTIIKNKQFSIIECEMDFGPMGISTSTFRFDSIENGTNITWSMDSEGKGITWYFYVMSKYINLFMDKGIGASFERGLKSLKSVSEAVPKKETIAGFDVEERMLEKMNVLSIRETLKNDEIGKRIGQNYSLIGQYMSKENIMEINSPMIILHNMDTAASEIEFAIPVGANAKSKGKIIFSELPSTNAYVVKFYGLYSKTAPVYDAAKKYIESKGKKISGPSREVYITDPGIEKDTAKWLTEIVFPIE